MKDTTILRGVGTPLIPKKGTDKINAPILMEASKKSGSKFTISDKYKPGNALTLIFNRLKSIINLEQQFDQI